MLLNRPAPCAIAVMAKASSPGRTKTRLTPLLTPQEAADLNTSFLQDIADNIARAARRTPIAAYMAYGPPGSEPFFREHLSSDIELIPAWEGDFGACLSAAMAAMFERGHSAACVLNADSPTLPCEVLVALAHALAEPGDRAVLGPADDGGYYVLGLKTLHAEMFQDIAWSTERVCAQTLERAAQIGLPVHLLPAWYDVDDADGLRRLRRDVFEAASGGYAPDLAPSPAEHTRARLAHLQQTADLDARLCDAEGAA